VSCQRSEVRGQRSEVRVSCQRSESVVRGQRSVVRVERAEVIGDLGLVKLIGSFNVCYFGTILLFFALSVFMIDVSFLILGFLWFLRVLVWLIIARIVFSWLLPQANGPVVRVIIDATEPVLRPIRKIVPRGSGAMAMMDWSPLIAVILLDILRGIIRGFL
jgi:YggT family protein